MQEEETDDDEVETADDLLNADDSEEEEDADGDEDEDEDGEQAPEEFIDESNPFYAAKKAQQQQAKAGPAKPSFKDTSDAAGDILRRLMERRRAEKNG